ncbi:ABC transporter ATP-binding protein [Paenibacillus polymyxa]|uniref:ABC transporter ATP-binding protein n=1 Tax=Paenibacillus polymyxa TaxID=1406 RepID=UPI0032177B4F
MEKIIEVIDLKKSFGDVQAVKGISFYVEKGQLFSFLGSNGAGKSTTIDMICTFTKPDSGTILVDGHELGKEDYEIRNSIGVVFQDGVLDPVLTVEENLKFRGHFYKLKDSQLKEAINRVAETTKITDILGRKYGTLSGGQRRRCDIARALLNTPKILFLDEPTTGLDPQTRKSVWDTILKLQEDSNMTIFLTTHYMEEAANAKYIVIMDKGKIIAQGSPDQLKENHTMDRLTLIANQPDEVQMILEKNGNDFSVSGNRITVKLTSTIEAKPLIDLCVQHVNAFEVTRGSMDDVFLNITGREIRE